MANEKYKTVSFLINYSDEYLARLLKLSAVITAGRKAATTTSLDVAYVMRTLGREMEGVPIDLRVEKRKSKDQKPTYDNFRSAEGYNRARKEFNNRR